MIGKITKIIVSFFLFSIYTNAQSPATEVRAVWLTTNWGLDWPKPNTSTESQKTALCYMLDSLQQLNFNVVLFQVRSQGTVMYRSTIEPMSLQIDKTSGFDPLAFAIDACHKRGLECHAWLVTYPMQKVKYTGKGRNQRAVMEYPDYYKLIDDRWYLDPGRPESRKLVVSLVKEIVDNYDVDGIHFDYIRYPGNPAKFPDEDSYRNFGNGKSLADWRRDNINKLVFEAYDAVKQRKNWVQVSSAPLGRYKPLAEVSLRDGWTAYESVFQDAGHWMQAGKHDLLFPMMYHRERFFFPFVDDWVANSNGRIIVPGLGIYQMLPSELNWSLTDITKQMDYLRMKSIQGQGYFRVANIMENLKGVGDVIKTYYPHPAKLPPLEWLDAVAPSPPIDFEVYKADNGLLHLKWKAPDDEERYTYNVYCSDSESIDVTNSANLLDVGLHRNESALAVGVGEYGLYFSVTASDRYHNESVVCPSAYIVFSEEVR